MRKRARLSKEALEKFAELARENRARLRKCRRHEFVRTPMDSLGHEWVCRACRGAVYAEAAGREADSMNAVVRHPIRVQLSRRKGWRMPPNTVKVSRPTKWGNPFRVTEDRTEADCAMAFSTWLRVETAHAGIPERRRWMLDHLHELRGKNLACWCRPGAMCHADVLLELANRMI